MPTDLLYPYCMLHLTWFLCQCAEGLKTSRSQESEQIKTCNSEVATTISEEFSEKVKIANQNTERTSYGSGGSNDADRPLSSQGSISVTAVNVDLSEAPQSTEESNLNSVSDSQKKVSTFEAAAAEEDLDMLLDSFSETKKVANPSGIRSNNAFPVFQQEASLSKHVPDSSKTPPVIADLDDSLDDLLEETSNVMNQNCLSQSLEGKSSLGIVQSSSSNTGTKSPVLDDFDSWLDTI